MKSLSGKTVIAECVSIFRSSGLFDCSTLGEKDSVLAHNWPSRPRNALKGIS